MLDSVPESRRCLNGPQAHTPDADPLLRARALAADGLSALAQGDYEDSRRSFAESLELLRAHGDASSIAFVLSKLGASHIMLGNTELAQAIGAALGPERAHRVVDALSALAGRTGGRLQLARASSSVIDLARRGLLDASILRALTGGRPPSSPGHDEP